LGIVVYEGYERGKPILASDVGGLKELVLDGETGRLLEPGDRAAWLEAVCRLGASQAHRWGIRGRRWLEENAQAAVWNRQFDAIIERVRAQKHLGK
jgi:glycosyltransferase involved in cell wall biosynthesis